MQQMNERIPCSGQRTAKEKARSQSTRGLPWSPLFTDGLHRRPRTLPETRGTRSAGEGAESLKREQRSIKGFNKRDAQPERAKMRSVTRENNLACRYSNAADSLAKICPAQQQLVGPCPNCASSGAVHLKLYQPVGDAEWTDEGQVDRMQEQRSKWCAPPCFLLSAAALKRRQQRGLLEQSCVPGGVSALAKYAIPLRPRCR